MYEQRTTVNNSYTRPLYREESKFDGGLGGLLGHGILAVLVIILTLGIAYPWMACMMARWEARHTVINGHRLSFDGTGGQLFGKWLVWLLLSIITLGIYGLWVPIRVKQWKTQHTSIEM